MSESASSSQSPRTQPHLDKLDNLVPKDLKELDVLGDPAKLAHDDVAPRKRDLPINPPIVLLAVRARPVPQHDRPPALPLLLAALRGSVPVLAGDAGLLALLLDLANESPGGFLLLSLALFRGLILGFSSGVGC